MRTKDSTRPLDWIEQAAQTVISEFQTEQYVEHDRSSARPTRATESSCIAFSVASNRTPEYKEVFQHIVPDSSPKSASQILIERQGLLHQC